MKARPRHFPPAVLSAFAGIIGEIGLNRKPKPSDVDIIREYAAIENARPEAMPPHRGMLHVKRSIQTRLNP